MREGLLIRADADDRVGAGHVMRCLALAQAWQDARFGPVCLVSTALPDGIRERYEREGVSVRLIGPGPLDFSRAVRDSGASWVVLDGYGFGIHEQQLVQGEGCRVLVVDDDGAEGQYVADLVVDHNVFAQERTYLRRMATTQLLLGPRYALLRREMRRSAEARTTQATATRVLVTFGGADPADLSPVALRALKALNARITIVLGTANPRRIALERAAAGASNVHVVSDVPNMRDLMDNADLALVAAGVTCLELAHAGVPQIVVATAENQHRVARALAEQGVARALGNATDVTESEIRDAVTALLNDGAIRREMGARGRALVDGRGAERVVRAMMIEGTQ